MSNKFTETARMLLFFGVLTGLHLFVRSFYLEKNPDCESAISSIRGYLNREETPDVLFAGNSHVWVGVNIASMPKAYTVAYLGESYVTTYYKLKYLIERRGPPKKAIVLQLDLHSFAPPPLESMQNPYSALYVDQLELARNYDHFGRVFLAWLKWDVFPYAGLGSTIPENLLFDKQLAKRNAEERFSRRFADVKRKESQAAQVADSHLPPYTLWKQDAEVDYFNRIAKLCADNGLKLVWVRFPASEEYYAQMLPRLPIDEWQAEVDSLVRQNPNVVLLDYHDVFFGRNEMFFDPNHLNRDGSVAFTRMLREQLVERSLLTEQP